jgi:threonine aldolase
MRTIDLRSDTVTKPTPAMRDAMAAARLGDDVYGEDPTVNQLQEQVADRLGKQAALFFPSGTMANQAALQLHTRPGEVVIATQGAHILEYEGGAAAALSGLQIRALGERGVLDAQALRGALPPDDPHCARVTLLALENTHNTSGGRVFPFEVWKDVTSAAREAGLALHLDGARLFNAAIASGRAVSEWAEPFDTVSICLSKGLGAPIGSIVASRREHARELLRVRKRLGGGMRQVGMLAAAGLYALDHHVERLADDHRNASRLAGGLQQLGLDVVERPETNIVLFRVADVGGLLARAKQRGVLLGAMGPGRIRAVTHLDVSAGDVDDALDRIASAL